MRTLVDSGLNVFVDTQLWVYAFKRPRRDGFRDEGEYRIALKMHEKAGALVREALLKHSVYVTTHQLAELFHALAFRGVKMSREAALSIVEKIAGSSKTVVVELKRRHYREALKLSGLSGIHVWDYLCVLPLRGSIDVAYTNDRHFLHPTFRRLVPKVENPLGKWLTV